MNRNAFLVVLACAFASPLVAVGTASAQPADRGLDGAPTAGADGFLGPRPLMKDLSTADQALLAKLINTYTSANGNAIVKIHMATMMDPKLHDVHKAPYTQLFSWHRTYIGGLETFLKANGGAKFVPLPKWIPSDPIPKVFGANLKGKSLIVNYDPKQDWTQFYHSKLGVFSEEVTKGPTDTTPDAKILANTLVVLHNNTHNTIGGQMSSMNSPGVPIFWCYHAFIDDIARDYESIQANPKLTARATAPDPAAEAQAVRTLTGVVHVSADGVTLESPAGTFKVSGDLASVLAHSEGKSVWVQAKLSGDTATVVSVIGDAAGMNDLPVISRISGKKIGHFMGMGDVPIIGAKGSQFIVRLPSGRTGFVPKTTVTIGEGSGMSMPETPGMKGALEKSR